MFFEQFPDQGDNPVNNPNIYNVEGDNRLSPGLQAPDNRKLLKNNLFSLVP